MRYSLIDLLIAVACYAFGVIGTLSVVKRAPFFAHSNSSVLLAFVFAILVSTLIYCVITPPIYRQFRLWPLFLPKCPHCRAPERCYRITESHWPCFIVVCTHCQKSSEQWWRRPSMADVSKTVPSLLLSWPESIGRWRLINRGDSE